MHTSLTTRCDLHKQLDPPVSLPLMQSPYTLDDDCASRTTGLGGEAMHSFTCLELSSPLVILFYDVTVPRTLQE